MRWNAGTRLGKLLLTHALAALLVWACATLLAPNAPRVRAAGEWHVCKTAGGDFTSIQAAVDAALPGDVIKVAAGVYTESKVVFASPYNLYISKTVHLFGGYMCGSWATRDPASNVVHIRPSTTNISVVLIEGQFGQSALLTPTLDGFTLSGGRSDNHGGGLRLVESDALISNNIITDNVGYLLGGGIWVQRGAPRFLNNTIGNNIADGQGQFAQGGGLQLEDTRATLNNNLISGNIVSGTVGQGGGVDISGGGPVVLSGNTIISNSAALQGTGYGGGISAQAVTLTLSSNLIQANKANAATSGHGGGVFITNSLAFTLLANTIISNSAGFASASGSYLLGGGVYIANSTGLLASNSVTGNLANRNNAFGNGGGLFSSGSKLDVRGGQISGNSVSVNCEGYGGGIYATNSQLTVDAVRVTNNCAANTPFYGLGGGLAFVSSPYTLTNLLIATNYAFGDDSSVGGIYAGANSPGLIVNNTLANNNAQGIRSASPLTLTNNIILGHTTGVSLTAAVAVSATYNAFFANTTNQRGFTLDISNLVINPQLDANYQLLATSPLIDAGTFNNAPDHDRDGEPRAMIGSSGLYRIDIGADERTGKAQRVYNLDTRAADLTIIGPGNVDAATNSDTDYIGYAVMGADVNGDGRADLVFSAEDWKEDDSDVLATGRVYALNHFGARITGTIDLLTTTASLTVVSRYKNKHLGSAFASADLNGDGNADLIIGSTHDDNAPVYSPTVFVLFGGAGLAGTRVLSDATPANFALRAPANDVDAFANHGALTAGDLNGDGTADLVVGDALADDGALNNTGAVFVVYGSPSLGGLRDLATTPADYTLYGPAPNAGLGQVALGRVNGDAQLDLVARSDTAAYVVFGPLSGASRHLSTTPADVTISGLQAGGVLVMDFDGDGQADLLLGSNDKLYVLRGPFAAGQSFNVVARAALTITNLGVQNLLAKGDVADDSRADLLIGSPSNTFSRVFVIAGGQTVTGTVRVEELAALRAHSTSVRFLGWDVAAGDLDGDGKGELIVGSQFAAVQNHPMFYEDAGKVFVFYGKSDQQFLYLPFVAR